MTKKPKADPIEEEIERALSPGVFISDHACFSFVNGLEEVEARLSGIDPSRAVSLYETFLAASYEKIEEIDDSSGSFGQFVVDLCCGWIKARQSVKSDPNETASLLLAWMEHDEYGFFYNLEKDAVKVLNKANLAAFISWSRAKFYAAINAALPTDDASRGRPEYLGRRWGKVLRMLYAAKKEIAAYIALAEETGLTAKDCHTIAELFVNRRKPEQALVWAERGLKLNKCLPNNTISKYELTDIKKDILTKLGRGKEALDSAWADYRTRPGKYSYNDLMKYVPKSEHAEWHKKAIEAAMGADLGSAIDLFLSTKEITRLAEIMQKSDDRALEDLSHYIAEPAAKKLDKTHTSLAARLWRAQGMRIICSKKSKYYDAAPSYFENAKECFKRAGMDAEWGKTIDQVRRDHHRKSGFMPGFERLAAGSGPSDEASFLEKAKMRWTERSRREP